MNVKAAAFRNPCDYPIDVDCGSRTLPRKFHKNLFEIRTIDTNILVLVDTYVSPYCYDF